jgi:hypothetical protein
VPADALAQEFCQRRGKGASQVSISEHAKEILTRFTREVWSEGDV